MCIENFRRKMLEHLIMNRANIQEKLRVRVKFTEATKIKAYSLDCRELKPIGVSPFL